MQRRLLEAEGRWVIPSAPPRRSSLSFPYSSALSRATSPRNVVGVPEVSAFSFARRRHQSRPKIYASIPVYIWRTKPKSRQQHFEQDNALVYLGALKRATSPRRWFGSFPLGLLHKRPALNPIVPHDHGIARVGLAPVTCVSGRGEYPTHRLENAPARRPVIQ